MDRREFLRWMGVASGASVLAGCDLSRKSEKLIPYLVPPEDGVIPGDATFVATACTECPVGCSVTARIRDERVVKVDGTPGHPVNDGALCIRGQASLNRLYNVDRIRQPMMQDGSGQLVPATWNQALAKVSQALKTTSGEHVLLSGRTSGSLSALIDEFAQRMSVRRLPEFELFSHAAIRQASNAVFGISTVPSLHPDRADVVVTVGADVLETFGHPVAFARALSRKHDSKEHFTWFHVEPHASMTGFKATERMSLKPGSEGYLLAFLLHSVAASQAASVPAVSIDKASEMTGMSRESLTKIADTLAHAHAPLVVAGGVSTASENGLDVARLAALIQRGTGQNGRTIDLSRSTDYSRVGTMADIDRLRARLDGNQIGTAILFNTDPVGLIPEGQAFAASLDKASFLVGVGTMMNATLERCDVVLPLSHSYESWGDVEPVAGVVNVIQPTMKPLFDTLSDGDVLLRIMTDAGAAAETTYQQYVMDRWARFFGGAAANMVKKGWVEGPAMTRPERIGAPDHRYTFDSAPAPKAALVIAPSVRWYDGRSAELELLKEIPDPLSTVSWDPWVSVGPETAAAMGLANRHEVELRVADWSARLPVLVQPGLQRDVFVIQRGVANPPAGWSRASGEAASMVDVAVTPTGRGVPTTILSGSLREEGRGSVPGHEPAHFGALKTMQEQHSHGGGHELKHEDVSFYPLPDYPTYRWAMAIDMDKCVGCSACVAACYIENNVAMSGRDQHLKGRELAWIRIEPYYSEDGTTLDTVPTMCQHCDYAPCEPVCPVYATYHNNEGLNVQVYNRCVGTRYCANNCPYKQRRFNWFSWEHRPHPMNLMTNPDVSMRGKGLMEKCTFCVQRLRKARDIAKDEKRDIKEGDFTTACAQACPGGAIAFGNLLDESSQVYQWAHDERSSRLLEELGTSPGVFYLRKRGGAHGA
ncbi:MAG TPA: molybdopterin-dependent oxidoreductase [Candidatus Krumholzibacteria bacterium]|nr:molybdopterin-dependent oxidoreductase [Candidatus Krumholzibacteria bacterium]